MNNHEREAMNERDFNNILERNGSDVPSEDVCTDVTPWRKAMDYVLFGIALCSITLNICGLNYILPTIGMVLSLLGFRTLRKENIWFRNCFILTVIRTAYHFSILILNTTILQKTIFTSQTTSNLTTVNFLLQIAEFFCLWCGLRAVQRKANLSPKAGGAFALIIWYVLMGILSIIRYNNLMIIVSMIIGYIFIIHNIYKHSKELDETRCSIQIISTKVTDLCIVFILVSILIIGCTLGYLFGGSYPMDWNTVDSSEHTKVEKIKNNLVELGFPENILNDLTPEDISACDGALQVVVHTTDTPMENLKLIPTYYDEEENNNTQETDSDTTKFCLTDIGVQLPGKQERWMIVHHFLWTANPGFYGTESIQLWPAYQNDPDGWSSDSKITGRLLYDKNGETMVAPYYSLEKQTFSSDSILWDNQTSTDVFATFSMPRQGKNHRGYVAYSTIAIQDDFFINSWVNYTHQQSWLQYPAMTAMEHRTTYTFDNEAFITVQNAFQFSQDEQWE